MLTTSSNPFGQIRHRLCAYKVACLVALLACAGIPVNAAPATDGYVGHLGGVPVNIPRAYGRFLEYDGDPNFMEKRKGEAPSRNYKSGIRGFAFEVHFPDMAVLDISKPEATPNENIFETQWLRVLISANSDFTADADVYMARVTKRIVSAGPAQDIELETPLYGLRAFRPANENPDVVRSKYAGVGGKRKYLELDADGKTRTYIECSTAKYASSECSMQFVLDPAVHASIKVSFRRALLENWRDIRASVSNVILNFRGSQKPAV